MNSNLYNVEIWFAQDNIYQEYQIIACDILDALVKASRYLPDDSKSGVTMVELRCKNWLALI